MRIMTNTESRHLDWKLADTAGGFEKEKNYWLDRFANGTGGVRFPFDFNDPGLRERHDISFELAGDLYIRLQVLSKKSSHTLHIILAAALALLLDKYNGVTAGAPEGVVTIGTPIYRQQKEAEFVNTVLPLRSTLSGDMTFKELLLQMKQTVMEAHQYQNYPMQVLTEHLGLEFSQLDFPLFSAALLLENIHPIDYIDHTRPPVLFIFSQDEADRILNCKIEYNGSLYREENVRRISVFFHRLLENITLELDTPIAQIEILSEDEKNRQLLEYNSGKTAVPHKKQLHRLFEEQVDRNPGNIAVILAESGDEITYKELNDRAETMARLFAVKGAGPGTIVAVNGERSSQLIAGLLGILKTGAAYLPLDPSWPGERIDYILQDSRAAILFNSDLLEIQEQGSTCTPTTVHTQLCYVIYTSGTTGKPKGTMLEHRGVVNYVCWAAQKYVKGEIVSFPFYTSIAFDLTVTSIFVPLVTGGSIVVYPGSSKEPLIDVVFKDNRVDVVKLTPAHLKLLRTKNLDKNRVRRLILGGEALETSLTREISEKYSHNIEIYNEYGPTETVVGSMIHRFQPLTDTGQFVPIGVPAANTGIYILDGKGNPLPIGANGEIYISGSGLARGYLNRPERTREQFVRLKGFPGTLYKTGDLARFLEDADGRMVMDFLGRLDEQVKIRGFRVELGEIESTLKHFKREPSPQKVTDKKNVCSRCILPGNYPAISFDEYGVCSVCREYDGYKNHVDNYFKEPADLDLLLQPIKDSAKGDYDVLLLFSGGKDSTFVLYKLIDMGLRILTFTFDNGYISESAFENIRRTTGNLGVDHITGDISDMKQVFLESLRANHNVCHGCWNALNTLGASLAHKHGIKYIFSGLSRGQIFDMRLHGLFRAGVYDEEDIREKLMVFRKAFHSEDNKFSRIISEKVPAEVVEETRFVDFFRYSKVSAPEILSFLSDKGWVKPADTGFCSSNCTINDVGIYVYFQETGHHFYAAPISWDIRLGVMERGQGLEELEFQADVNRIRQVLDEIGYHRSNHLDNAAVLANTGENGESYLCAYIVPAGHLAPSVSEIRGYLSRRLPDYMVPSRYIQVDKIPLTVNGKVDKRALLRIEGKPLKLSVTYVAPKSHMEKLVADICKDTFKVDQVGIDDNFFDLGATSFEIINVTHRLEQELQQEIPVLALFEHPTISSFLSSIQDLESGSVSIKAEEAKKQEDQWIHEMNKGKNKLLNRRKRRITE